MTYWHLAPLMERPWRWGVADCCASACDLFREAHGIDPMAPLRGAYASGIAAARIIAGAGGMRPLAASLARTAGLRDGRGGAGEIGVSGRSLVFCVAPGLWIGKTRAGWATVEPAEVSWRA